jgi:hypothetical protein
MASQESNALRRRAAEERLETLLTDNGGTATPANVTGGQEVLRNAKLLENLASLLEILFAKRAARK